MNADAGAGALYDATPTVLMLALAAGATGATAGEVYGGPPIALAALTAGAVATVGWMATGRRGSGAPSRAEAFNVYVAVLVALMAFYAEEWAGDFPAALAHLFPRAYPEGPLLSLHAYVAVFPLGTMALFVLGALAYYHRLALGRLAAWVAFSWGAVVALGAYGLALAGEPGFGYMPGMATAPVLLALSLRGMRRLAGGGAARAEEAP